MKVSIEHVTPSLAERWLNKNTFNRKMREGVAEKYTKDMKAGRWTDCAAPIVFYENGDLCDGQHRLWAVSESGCGQDFLILRDFPQGAALNLDTGAVRRLLDNAKFTGRTELSHALLATTRAMEGDPSKRRNLSYAARLLLFDKYHDGAQWAISNLLHKRGLSNTLTNVAVARAYYAGEEQTRLKYFCDVLAKGFSRGDEDSSAVAIRNYLMSLPHYAAEPWDELSRKVQNAIWYFMRRKKLTFVKRVAEERYPLRGKFPRSVRESGAERAVEKE